MEVAISTLAFIGKTAEEIVSIATENKYAIEFSSGMPYRSDMEQFFINAPLKKYAHNYFPAPEFPFVLNLASSNEEIRTKSIQHCIKGLELSKKVNSPFFSAHAGFCIDPKPTELGRQLEVNQPFNRQEHWGLFLESIKIILIKANELNVKFLIENNVLAQMNVTKEGINPLLCVDSKEIKKVMVEMNDNNLGILLDTAHLKVSSNTLNFSLDQSVIEIQEYIQCIHHSDNDGLLDTNESLNENYWFKKHIITFENILHVLEVKKLSTQEINKQIKILLNC